MKQSITKFFILFFLVNTSSVFALNSMSKALVEKNELRLSFSNSFNKKNVRHFVLHHPYREIYDFKQTRLSHKRVPLGLGKYVKLAQNKSDTVRVVISHSNNHKSIGYQPLFAKNVYHISLPKDSKSTRKKRTTPIPPFISKTITYSSSNKKQVIVIDAGHGGHDSGAIGGKRYEKDLVLAIAKKTSKALNRLGYNVYLTRNSNRFLKLSERTHIADRKKAVAFISIHANSVPKRKRNKVQGIETFFLQNTRDEKSQRIARRENAAVLKGAGSKLSKKVIIDSVLNGPKIVESNKLAIDVQKRIITNLRKKYKGVKDGGVRHAPFYVLVGASRPSILVEVGYISHPKERKRLFSSRYQKLLAKGIAEGVSNYLTIRRKEVGF